MIVKGRIVVTRMIIMIFTVCIIISVSFAFEANNNDPLHFSQNQPNILSSEDFKLINVIPKTIINILNTVTYVIPKTVTNVIPKTVMNVVPKPVINVGSEIFHKMKEIVGLGSRTGFVRFTK